MPLLLPIFWAVVTGGAAYAGTKLAESAPDQKQPRNNESINIPVKSGVNTSGVVALSVTAGVVLALLAKRGK